MKRGSALARPPQSLIPAALGGLLLLLLAMPVIAPFVALSPRELWAGLGSPAALAALQVSLRSTALSLLVVVAGGTPLAYWLARGDFRGKSLIETLVDLPVALPPAVLGVGLLLAFGRRGLLGPALEAAGVQISFSFAAVVIAQTVVSAPLYIRTAQESFSSVDVRLDQVARSLGAGPAQAFRRVWLPLALPGMVTGAALAWARALGEFGATILFAGNLPGRTQTLPLAIYTAMESDLRVAVALSTVLAVVGFAILLTAKIWRSSAGRR